MTRSPVFSPRDNLHQHQQQQQRSRIPASKKSHQRMPHQETCHEGRRANSANDNRSPLCGRHPSWQAPPSLATDRTTNQESRLDHECCPHFCHQCLRQQQHQQQEDQRRFGPESDSTVQPLPTLPFWYSHEEPSHVCRIMCHYATAMKLNHGRPDNSRTPLQFVGRVKRYELNLDFEDQDHQICHDEDEFRTLDEVRVYQRVIRPLGMSMPFVQMATFLTTWNSDGLPHHSTMIVDAKLRETWMSQTKSNSTSYLYSMPVDVFGDFCFFPSCEELCSVGYSGTLSSILAKCLPEKCIDPVLLTDDNCSTIDLFSSDDFDQCAVDVPLSCDHAISSNNVATPTLTTSKASNSSSNNNRPTPLKMTAHKTEVFPQSESQQTTTPNSTFTLAAASATTTTTTPTMATIGEAISSFNTPTSKLCIECVREYDSVLSPYSINRFTENDFLFAATSTKDYDDWEQSWSDCPVSDSDESSPISLTDQEC